MIGNDLSLLIMSCDKFSDLWDGHVKLLSKNWHDRGCATYLVSDKQREACYENVTLLCAGEDLEWSDRLAFALQQVRSEYVLVTLDDYYLIETVSNTTMEGLLSIMRAEDLDYLRLYPRHKCKKEARVKKYGKYYTIDTTERYSVNLYPGIWRTAMLRQMIGEPKDAWHFEVSLPRMATAAHAKCAMIDNGEFVFLDVVRKGKLLNRAARYFKKHDVYHGNREVISRFYEFKLAVKTWGVRIMPKPITDFVRFVMIKLGHHYYSQDFK